MTETRIPRPQLAELRTYLRGLPSDRVVHLAELATAMDISERTIRAIEQGIRLQHGDISQDRPIRNLIAFLVREKLLNPALADDFAQDFSDRRSVISYLPKLSTHPSPQMQDACVLRSVQDAARAVRPLDEPVVGYARELAQADEALRAGKRVLLHGLGGAGKTSLASVIAIRHVERGEHVVWLEVGEAAEADILRELRAKLPDRDRLQSALVAARISLVILDNVWTDVIQGVLDAIPPRVGVLLTARGNVSIRNKARVLLDGIAPDDALTLLSHYSGKDMAQERGSSLDLCKKLGWHPHPIMLAGKAIERSGGQLSAEAISQNLSTFVYHGASGRDASLSALVEQNFYSPLIPPEHREKVRTVFSAFGSLFAPRAPLELIGRWYGAAAEAQWMLDYYLLPLNMVQRQQKSATGTGIEIIYSMHDSLYAVSIGRRSPEEAERGARLLLEVITQHFDGGRQGRFEDVYVLRDNMLGMAATLLAEKPQRAASATLFYALMCKLLFGGYFDTKGYRGDWLAYLEAAAAQAEAQQQWRDAHYFQAKLGNGYRSVYGDDGADRAARAYQAAGRLAAKLDLGPERTWREALSISLVGAMNFLEGKQQEAKQHFAEAEARAAGDLLALSQIYEHQGVFAASRLRDFDAARDLFFKSLRAAIQIPLHEPTGVGSQAIGVRRNTRRFHVWINLGETEKDDKRFELALKYVCKALKCARKTGSDDLIIRGLQEVGTDLLILNRREEAVEIFTEALMLCKRSEDEVRHSKIRRIVQDAFLNIPEEMLSNE